MLFNHQKQANQTEFIAEAPILTDVSETEMTDQEKAQKERQRQLLKKFFLILGISFMLIALLIVFANLLYHPVKREKHHLAPLPSPVVSIKDHSLLEQLKTLKQSFLAHDPAEKQLMFPNVSKTIYLDAPKTN